MSKPNYHKTILCLADSYRPGGYCVAGKEFTEGKSGDWIRPISGRSSHEISIMEKRYQDGKFLALLDVVSIPMLEPRPMDHQTENHIIVNGQPWVKKSRATWGQIVAATDKVSGPLWLDGVTSNHGHNDKVPALRAKTLKGSLFLVAPENLKLAVDWEPNYKGGKRRRVRADFHLNGAYYKFVVTDPVIKAKYLQEKDGIYPIKDSRLCVSLSEVIGNAAIKLAAAVITPDRAG